MYVFDQCKHSRISKIDRSVDFIRKMGIKVCLYNYISRPVPDALGLDPIEGRPNRRPGRIDAAAFADRIGTFDEAKPVRIVVCGPPPFEESLVAMATGDFSET